MIKKISYIIISLGLIAILFAFLITYNKTDQERIRVAVCPTYFKLLEPLVDKFEIVQTNSTSESLVLLGNNLVDIVICGRILKPDEPEFEFLVLKEGYSFLSNKEIKVYSSELKDYNIYTDLDIDMLKSEFPIKKIEKVDNVYAYLSHGIIITSWDNTDYSKAGMVHLFKEENKRDRSSRQMTLFYNEYSSEKAKRAYALLEENE